MLAVALVAGCGKGEQKQADSQVAARVNSDEITVHEINNVLARTPNVTPETAEKAKREILDQLIDQQLARQRAIDKKLDRSPTVVQALEAAKSEILARAYLEQIALTQPKITPDEVKKYYAEHPELFEHRRVFNLEEIIFAANGAVAAELGQRIEKARSMQEIGDWLQSRGVKFSPSRGVRTAEQIPLEYLPSLQRAKDGEFQVIESGGSYHVIRVVGFKEAPVDEATAASRIEQFLFNQRSRDAIAKELKQAKAQSKIEYLGEFAGGAAAAAAATKAKADAAAKALAETNAKAADEAKARAEALSAARTAAQAKAKANAVPPKAVQLPQENVEKGIRGLK
jgi:EpsD family peptidyl-prolyl cis-trans isomerase